MLSSRPYQRRGKVGHRGSRLQNFEFTLLSHITIHLTSLPLAPGCSLHHIHCQVKHPGPLFNTQQHSPTLTLTPAHFDVAVKNGADDHSAAICFHTNFIDICIWNMRSWCILLEPLIGRRHSEIRVGIWSVLRWTWIARICHVQVEGPKFTHSSEPQITIYPLKYILWVLNRTEHSKDCIKTFYIKQGLACTAALTPTLLNIHLSFCIFDMRESLRQYWLEIRK